MSYKNEMNRSKNTGFADRLSAAADAKKARLERAARARSAAESPSAVERRMAPEAIRVARDSRIAKRKATKFAVETRQAAALAAAREAALKAEQTAHDAQRNRQVSQSWTYCGTREAMWDTSNH